MKAGFVWALLLLGVAACRPSAEGRQEVGSKPGCDVIPIGTNGSLVIECGGPPGPPPKPEPPDKPDKPDKGDSTNRRAYINADREWTARSIDQVMKAPIDAVSKQRAIEGLQQHHQDCVAGRSKCVGEP